MFHRPRSSRMFPLVLAIFSLASHAPAGQAGGVETPSLPEAIDPAWWALARDNIEASEYEPRGLRTEGESIARLLSSETSARGSEVQYQTSNRVHGLRTFFVDDLFVTVPREWDERTPPAWSWGLELRRFGRGDDPAPVPSAAPCLSPDRTLQRSVRIEYDRGELLEWYINDRRGLEQGFTIAKRPGCSATGTVADRLPLRLEFAVRGTLLPRPDESDRGIRFVDPTHDIAVIHFGGLVAFDAAGRELASRFEIVGDGPGSSTIALTVDDADAVYPVIIDPIATSPAWTAQGNQAGASFGSAVAGVGDVDADGFGDVVVLAPSFDGAFPNGGRAFLFRGSARGLAPDAAWTFDGPQSGFFGDGAVAAAGDVNGDGFSDVILGAALADGGETDEGRALVFHGSAGGLGATPDWTAEPDIAGAAFGDAVAGAGDVNGDGYSDVIVGAYAYSSGEYREGAAFLYLGSPNGLGARSSWSIESNQVDAWMGRSVASAGDVNADGYADVIVGTPYFAGGITAQGRAQIHHGGPAGLSAAPNWTQLGAQFFHLFGASVAGIGDVNGDGFADIAAGAPGASGGGTQSGRIEVYRGSSTGVGSSGPTILNGTTSYELLGYEVQAVGDVNGDGFADLLAGLDYIVQGFPLSEYGWGARIYAGSSTGISATLHWEIEFSSPSQSPGFTVAGAGDVNGDGLADIVVGSRGAQVDEAGEGTASIYLGAVNGVRTTPSWSAGLSTNDANYGYSVAAAGDVNGDGFGDVIVGAPYHFAGQFQEGVVFLYLGSPNGLVTLAQSFIIGGQATGWFGYSVAGAGDVNGDGYADVIVGQPSYSGPESNEGRALIYHGSADGLANVPAWTGESNQSGANYGWSVAGAGDFNGDGFPDVVIGIPLYDGGQTDEGRVVAHIGLPTGVHPLPAWVVESNQALAEFGRSVAGAGDVDGDGIGDLLVGAPRFDNGQTNEGRAFVYLGRPFVSPSPTPIWTAESDSLQALFGDSVAAGDFNGDGFSDVLIGAPDYKPGASSTGRAAVYFGGPDGPSPAVDWFVDSTQGSSKLGSSVASAGDVNGDGYSDLLIGARSWNVTGLVDAGRVFLHLGGPDGPANTAAWTATGEAPGDEFGTSVAGAGDVNGDGYADLLIGAPLNDGAFDDSGKAYLYTSNTIAAARPSLPRQLQPDLVTAIGPGGVSSSESSFALELRANSVLGRTLLGIEHEVKPWGEPFDGVGLSVVPSSDTGADGTITSAVALPRLISGTHYHWRSRVVYHPAKGSLQRHGPWLHMATRGWNESDLRTAGLPPAPCPSDLSGDGMIDGADLGAVLSAWGPCAGCAADLNDDGVVDGGDLGALLSSWGGCG